MYDVSCLLLVSQLVFRLTGLMIATKIWYLLVTAGASIQQKGVYNINTYTHLLLFYIAQ